MLALSLALWSGCSRAPMPPFGVPDGAHKLWVDDDYQIHMGTDTVMHWSAVADAPTEPFEETLTTALRSGAQAPLWVLLPPETAFWGVRRVLGSAKEAGTGSVFLTGKGNLAESFLITPPPKYQYKASCDAPIPVTGAESLLTLSLQGGPEEAWVIASARFVPVTSDGPTDGLPDECLAVPPCEDLFPEGPLREACLSSGGSPAQGRVTLGGERGCLLPIAKKPRDTETWRQELARLIPVLGLDKRPQLVVMPEASTRLDALLALLGAFSNAHLPAPAVGVSMLVEGNDGPPVCNASIQSAQQLDEASARWLGSHRPAAAPVP